MANNQNNSTAQISLDNLFKNGDITLSLACLVLATSDLPTSNFFNDYISFENFILNHIKPKDDCISKKDFCKITNILKG